MIALTYLVSSSEEEALLFPNFQRSFDLFSTFFQRGGQSYKPYVYRPKNFQTFLIFPPKNQPLFFKRSAKV
jgi:hypothetical protein